MAWPVLVTINPALPFSRHSPFNSIDDLSHRSGVDVGVLVVVGVREAVGVGVLVLVAVDVGVLVGAQSFVLFVLNVIVLGLFHPP